LLRNIYSKKVQLNQEYIYSDLHDIFSMKSREQRLPSWWANILESMDIYLHKMPKWQSRALPMNHLPCGFPSTKSRGEGAQGNFNFEEMRLELRDD